MASKFARTKYDKTKVDAEDNAFPAGSNIILDSRPASAAPLDRDEMEDDISKQLLANGFVQSYVDFYHLTNRIDPATALSQNKSRLQVPEKDMKFIRDNLVAAEIARRGGNTAGVFTSLNKLANFYSNNGDYKTSIFFHEKRLEVAQLVGDDRSMMSANHSIGIIYQKSHDYETAKIFHEKHEETALNYDVAEEIAVANTELLKVYQVIAKEREVKGAFAEAQELYIKCLEAAKKCWDRASEGRINGKIGNLLLQCGDTMACLPYLRQQSQIASDMSDADERCKACSSLAIAFEMLGQSDKALDELTLVHKISEQAGDTLLQSQACKALGILYSKMGKLEMASDSLQLHFNLVKGILASKVTKAPPDTKKPNISVMGNRDMDLARIFVGASSGNVMMKSYVQTMQSNPMNLLDWKMNRSSFLPAPAPLE